MDNFVRFEDLAGSHCADDPRLDGWKPQPLDLDLMPVETEMLDDLDDEITLSEALAEGKARRAWRRERKLNSRNPY